MTKRPEDVGLAPFIALAFAAASLFFGPCVGWPVAVVGAVAAAVAIIRGRRKTAAMFVLTVLVGLSSSLTNGLRWGFANDYPRSKQAECRTYLKTIAHAQRQYFEQNQRFSERPAEIRFWPERGARYSYALSRDIVFVSDVGNGADLGTALRAWSTKPVDDLRLLTTALAAGFTGGVSPGISGECPDCSFTAVCVANIDGDDDLDIWSISSIERVAPNGMRLLANDPHCEANDIE